MKILLEKIIEKANMFWGAFTVFMTSILGTHWSLFLGFLMLNVVDYVTGFIKAKYYTKSESSAVGAKGIAKKVGYWVVICVAFFISDCFVELGNTTGINLSFVTLFGWFTLASYLINEIRSILENLVEMKVAVPEFLIRGLDVTKKILDAKTEDVVGADSTESEEA